jgi:uncharacterized protein
MTPQERQLVTELFERLENLENTPRDREADAAIAEGLRYAPNAIYPLVQTVLVQDEALKRADARIRALEAELDGPGEARQGGFLDSMRDTLFGREQPRGSVPPVRPEGGPMGVPPGFRTGAASEPYGAPQQQPGGQGGSFLGTAAAAAAGAVGGAMMLQSIRSMFGEKQGAFGALGSSTGVGGTTGGSGEVPSDLARQVRLDDLGGERTAGADEDRNREDSYSLLDDEAAEDDGDFDGDFGDDVGGDGDGP